MKTSKRYSPEIKERAVQLVFDHQQEHESQWGALWSRSDAEGLIHHRDRGSQYLSIRYTDRLTEAGLESSVGSAGGSYENALAESINGLYKTEVIRRKGPWQHDSN